MDRTQQILYVDPSELLQASKYVEEEKKQLASGGPPDDIDDVDELDFDEGVDESNAVPEDDLADGGVGEISRVDPREFGTAMTTNLIN